MRIAFRSAETADYDYCATLYFAELEQIIRDLNQDMSGHADRVRQLWIPAEVRIITVDGADAGWVQTRIEDDALFLAQFIKPRVKTGYIVPFVGQIGVVHRSPIAKDRPSIL